MYLYPDSIHTYWMIYFFSSVCFHIVLDILTKTEIRPYRYLFGILLFATSYQSIYILYRKPVLDELWPFWPETKKQKEYFKSIPSRITSNSSFDEDKYERKKCLFCYISIIVYRNFLKIKEDLFFCKYTYLKLTCYFNRPVFFNPQGSIQEGLLRAAIADFFAVEKKSKFALNIFVYFIPHVLVSFCYLLLNLLCAFRYHPYNNQKETISLVVLIVVWAFVSIFVLYKQYISIKLFYDMDKKLFSFSPKNVEDFAARKMQRNKIFTNEFDPKKVISIIYIAAVAIYLAILNLVMQYGEPKDNEDNKTEIELNVKKECSQFNMKIVESDICKEK